MIVEKNNIYLIIILFLSSSMFICTFAKAVLSSTPKTLLRSHLNQPNMQRDKVFGNQRVPRSTIESNQVAYFSGEEIIRYSNLKLNFDHFTITFWISIEGGQTNRSSIYRQFLLD